MNDNGVHLGSIYIQYKVQYKNNIKSQNLKSLVSGLGQSMGVLNVFKPVVERRNSHI